MKILLVVDQFDNANNGMTISARRFAKGLEEAGHEIFIVAVGEEREKKHTMEEYKLFPIARDIIYAQGMKFAKPNDKKLRKAIKSVDIVHCYTPFMLSIHAAKLARELNVPVTAAFHVPPEIITAAVRMEGMEVLNTTIYKKLHDLFYKYVDHIHCPSKNIAKELVKNGYKQKLHVISNGIAEEYKYIETEKPEELKDKFVIAMIGRLSREKRQNIIIDAIKKSKYEDKIQLILAGKGPKQRSYAKLGSRLTNRPIIDFYNKKDLMNILGYIDLYIHSSEIEIEGMSCTEAIACGNVPIIAKGPKTATSQFAIVEESIFECCNSDDLKEKIEFWYERDDYRKRMQKEYAIFATNYTLNKSVKQLSKMFEEAIESNKKG